MRIVLTIAGSDSSGGAGIQADLKTIAAFDQFGMSVITAITAQNSQGISLVHVLPPNVIEAQLAALFNDYDIAAIKIGMVGSAAVAALLGDFLRPYAGIPLVLDTPLAATTGAALGDQETAASLVEHLFPLATLVTPNLDEAGVFLKTATAQSLAEMKSQAGDLCALGARAVLLKGGHLPELLMKEGGGVADVFYESGAPTPQIFSAPYVNVSHRHGTGCTLASAIASLMATGKGLEPAVKRAKNWLNQCLCGSSQMGLGHGNGPVLISKMTKFED